jgi:hypothetical protein
VLAAWTAVVLDTRLTPEACRATLYVASLGSGEHEVRWTDFAALLNHPGEKAVRAALRVAVDAEWIERRAGGRGHPDRYSFRVPPGAAVSDTVPPAGSLNGLRVPPGASLSERSSSKEVDVEVGSELPHAREAFFPIAESALAAIDSRATDFNGCRSAVTDYLARRVPTNRQHGWVFTVAGWFDGIDASVFKYPTGMKAPPAEWPKVMAAGLNELMATDESRMSRPVGDPGNLKTKIQILLKQWAHNANPDHGGPTIATRANPGFGSNQGRHAVEG